MKCYFLVLSLLLLGCHRELEKPKEQDYTEMISALFSGDLAYETTAFVEQYWRVVGNSGFNASIYKIAEGLEAAGYRMENDSTKDARLTYRIEKRIMKNPTWEPVDASLTIVGDEKPILEQASNRNMVYLNSPSTGSNGVEGALIYVANKEELAKVNLKGKIVMAEMGLTSLEKQAQEQGAIGVLTYNNPAYLQPEKNVTSIQFRSMRYRDNNTMWAIALSYRAKELLKERLKKGAVRLHVNIQTKFYRSEELTIIADVKGGVKPEERLVFSAHVQEPGANDNATGVGTQLEMASITAQLVNEKIIDPKRTLTFLWGDEIVSTRRYIEEDRERAKGIKWGISLDMVGENTEITGGSFLIEKMPDPSAIWTRGNDKHSEWGGRVLRLEDMKPHYLNDFIIDQFKQQGARANWMVKTNPYEGGSDHTPFLRNDIPGLLLWHFTDQFYHTDNDRLDKVSQETMKNVGIATLTSALILVNANESLALEILETVKSAAIQRLRNEIKLSKEAIQQGEDAIEQGAIVVAWLDWYLKTADSLTDLLFSESMSLEKTIQETKAELHHLVSQEMPSLDLPSL
ncbi:M28 family peptidase [Flavobacteriaceae bacterium F08102]|nr:M28 family peptidase [Flavobacteriaceae bacterium F08102]